MASESQTHHSVQKNDEFFRKGNHTNVSPVSQELRQSDHSMHYKAKDSSTLPSCLSPPNYEDMSPPGRKRRKFWGFRSLVKILRRGRLRRKRSSASSSQLQTSVSPTRSDSEWTLDSTREGSVPYNQALSVSHDSVFSPEGLPDCGSAVPSSVPPSSSRLNICELKAAIRKRCSSSQGIDDDQDDPGLPRSPPAASPTTQDAFPQSLKNSSHHGQSSCSDGSLLSIGSSECDDESLSWHSSKHSLNESRFHTVDHEPTLGAAPSLSHNAAKHKIAIRPKKTRSAPRLRSQSQVKHPGLPVTPEVNESIIGPVLSGESGVECRSGRNFDRSLSSDITGHVSMITDSSPVWRELYRSSDVRKEEELRSVKVERISGDEEVDSDLVSGRQWLPGSETSFRGRRNVKKSRKSHRHRSDPSGVLPPPEEASRVEEEETSCGSQRSSSVEGRIEGNSSRSPSCSAWLVDGSVSVVESEPNNGLPHMKPGSRAPVYYTSSSVTANIQGSSRVPAIDYFSSIPPSSVERRSSTEGMTQTALPGIFIRSNQNIISSVESPVSTYILNEAQNFEKASGDNQPLFENNFNRSSPHRKPQDFRKSISVCEITGIRDEFHQINECCLEQSSIILRSSSVKSSTREKETISSGVASNNLILKKGARSSSKEKTVIYDSTALKLNLSLNKKEVSDFILDFDIETAIDDNSSQTTEADSCKTPHTKNVTYLNKGNLSANDFAHDQLPGAGSHIVNTHAANETMLNRSHDSHNSSTDSEEQKSTSKSEIVLRRPSVVDKAVVLDQTLSSTIASKEDQPELFKVFARRSIKIRDGDDIVIPSSLPEMDFYPSLGSEKHTPATRNNSCQSEFSLYRSSSKSDECSVVPPDSQSRENDGYKINFEISQSRECSRVSPFSLPTNKSLDHCLDEIPKIVTLTGNLSVSSHKPNISNDFSQPGKENKCSSLSNSQVVPCQKNVVEHVIYENFTFLNTCKDSKEDPILKDTLVKPSFIRSCEKSDSLDISSCRSYFEAKSAKDESQLKISEPSATPTQESKPPTSLGETKVSSSEPLIEPHSLLGENDTLPSNSFIVTEARNSTVICSSVLSFSGATLSSSVPPMSMNRESKEIGSLNTTSSALPTASNQVNEVDTTPVTSSSPPKDTKVTNESKEAGREGWREIARRRKELRMKQTKTGEIKATEEAKDSSPPNRNSKVLELANNFQKLQVA